MSIIKTYVPLAQYQPMQNLLQNGNNMYIQVPGIQCGTQQINLQTQGKFIMSLQGSTTQLYIKEDGKNNLQISPDQLEGLIVQNMTIVNLSSSTITIGTLDIGYNMTAILAWQFSIQSLDLATSTAALGATGSQVNTNAGDISTIQGQISTLNTFQSDAQSSDLATSTAALGATGSSISSLNTFQSDAQSLDLATSTAALGATGSQVNTNAGDISTIQGQISTLNTFQSDAQSSNLATSTTALGATGSSISSLNTFQSNAQSSNQTTSVAALGWVGQYAGTLGSGVITDMLNDIGDLKTFQSNAQSSTAATSTAALGATGTSVVALNTFQSNVQSSTLATSKAALGAFGAGFANVQSFTQGNTLLFGAIRMVYGFAYCEFASTPYTFTLQERVSNTYCCQVSVLTSGSVYPVVNALPNASGTYGTNIDEIIISASLDSVNVSYLVIGPI